MIQYKQFINKIFFYPIRNARFSSHCLWHLWLGIFPRLVIQFLSLGLQELGIKEVRFITKSPTSPHLFSTLTPMLYFFLTHLLIHSVEGYKLDYPVLNFTGFLFYAVTFVVGFYGKDNPYNNYGLGNVIALYMRYNWPKYSRNFKLNSHKIDSLSLLSYQGTFKHIYSLLNP